MVKVPISTDQSVLIGYYVVLVLDHSGGGMEGRKGQVEQFDELQCGT